jgi:putative acetyltransferase
VIKPEMLSIRKFSEGMEQDLWSVFHSSIRLGCTDDYAPEQLTAWAPNEYEADLWSKHIRSICPYVAVLGSAIVGYADLQKDGYVDHFFVHGQYQSLGIGARLISHILAVGDPFDRIYTHASITAKPFFEHYGFIVVTPQEVEIRGVKLKNYLMERV